MKNTGKVLGLAVIAAIVCSAALLFTACDTGTGVPGTTFTNIQAFHEWLDKQPANTPGTPYIVELNVKDISGISWWDGGRNPNKYVYLNLYRRDKMTARTPPCLIPVFLIQQNSDNC
jgi:hypothetical protein